MLDGFLLCASGRFCKFGSNQAHGFSFRSSASCWKELLLPESNTSWRPLSSVARGSPRSRDQLGLCFLPVKEMISLAVQ